MRYVLGLDISTTGAKALLVDETGVVVTSHTTPQPISTPKPLWSEQNPVDWWTGIVGAIKAVIEQTSAAKDITAIGLTGQMHGLVCLDAQGNVLRPSILWNDQRTQAECDYITETIGAPRLIQLTGNRALTGFTAPKIVWVREHEPDVYAKIAHILLPKDYIRYCLTGAFAADLSDASGMLLLDVAKRNWSDDVLHALEIPLDWLPQVYEGTSVTGSITDAIAKQTGLIAGTPVIAGGGDQAAQAVGVGAVKPGVIALTVGTSGVVFAPLGSYAYEPEGRLHAFCHALPGQWHFMAVMLSAAGSLQWYRDTLAPDVEFSALVEEAAAISVGSEGLQFLPYLTGERTPHPDPLARGAFIGLNVRHTRAHMTRAVLEGVAFGLRDSFELIKQSPAAKEITQVRLSGGGARSPIWRQILADVLNTSLTCVAETEGAAYGAALLAGIGAGVWSDVESATTFNQIDDVVNPTRSDAYEQPYEIYRSLYPTLKHTFAMLSQ